MSSRGDGPQTAAQVSLEQPYPTCRVLSYNMSMLPLGYGHGDGYKDERLHEFAERCEASYDVLILQELYASTILPTVVQGALCKQRKLLSLLRARGFAFYALPKQPSYLAMLKTRTAATDAGLLIVSRFPITLRGFHALQTPKGLDAVTAKQLSANKGIVFAKVQLTPNQAVLVFDVHTQTLAGVASESAQRAIIAAQGAEIRQFIEFVAFEHSACPIIVGGAFNCNSIPRAGGSAALIGYGDDAAVVQAPFPATVGAPPASARVVASQEPAASEGGSPARKVGDDSWQFDALISAMDPERTFTEVVSQSLGYHPPTRPPELEYPSSVHVISSFSYPSRGDYLFFRRAISAASRSSTGAVEVVLVAGSAHVEKFVAGPGAPFKYLSDHFALVVEVGLARCEKPPHDLASRERLVRGLDPDDEELLACPAVRSAAGAVLRQIPPLDVGGGKTRPPPPWSSSIPPSLATLRDSGAPLVKSIPSMLSRRRAEWHKLAAAATGSEETGYRLSAFVEALVIPLILYQLWAVPWLRYVLLLLVTAFAAQRMFGNQVLTIKAERGFGRVTDAVKSGLAPVVLIHNNTKHQSPRLAGVASISSLREVASTPHTPLSRRPPSAAFPVAVTAQPALTLGAAFQEVVDVIGWRQCLTSRAPSVGATTTLSFLSYKDVETKMLAIAANLRRVVGLSKGDRVAIYAESSPLCTIVDLACMHAGLVTVALAGEPRLARYVLDATDTRVVFTTHQHVAKVLHSRSRTIREVFQLDAIGKEEAAIALETGVRLSPADMLLHTADSSTAEADSTDPAPRVSPDDPATIVFHFDDSQKIPPGTTNLFTATVRLQTKTHAQLLEEVTALLECNVVPACAWKSQPLPSNAKGATTAASGAHSLSPTSSRFNLLPVGNATLDDGTSASDRVLIMAPYSSFFERLLSYGFLLNGHQLAHGTFREDFALFAPTVICASAHTFQLLHTQFMQLSKRWSKPYRYFFGRAFAFRSRLIRLGRDSKSLRWFFCNQFRQQFGGNFRRVIVTNGAESSSYALREFISVCYSPLMREVVVRPEVGVVSIDGIPPPRRLTRLVSLGETVTDGAASVIGGAQPVMEQAGLGVLLVRRQQQQRGCEQASSGAVVDQESADADGAEWRNSGLVAKWRNTQLQVLCPLDAMLWPASRIPSEAPSFVNAIDVERQYRPGLAHLVTNFFVTCAFDRPLVAIIVPNRDSVLEWLREQSLVRKSNVGDRGGELLSATATWPQLVAAAQPAFVELLAQIHRERKMAPNHVVGLVHLHPHPFVQHSDFLTHTLQHRRSRITAYFSRAIMRLGGGHASSGNGGSSVHGPEDGGASSSSSPPLASLLPITASFGASASTSRLPAGSVSITDIAESPQLRSPLTVAEPLAADLSGPTRGKSPPPSLGHSVIEPPLPASMSAARIGAASAVPSVATDDATHQLPGGAVPRLTFAAPVAVDIGGTCCKVVFFRPPGAPSGLPDFCQIDDSHDFERVIALDQVADAFFLSAPSGDNGAAAEAQRSTVLRFAKMPSVRVPDFIDFVARSGVQGHFRREAVARVPATGGGAYKFSRLAGERLGVILEPCKEMDGIIKGLNFLLHYAPNSIFTYDVEHDVQRPPKLGGPVVADPQPAGAAGGEPSSLYPYLLVNIGSGVSIVKCTGPDGAYVRVGGSPIGGATFWGLVRSLTSIRTWEEVHEMTRVDGPGDNTNVDLLVGDIYGFNAVNLPQRLTVDTVASTFGKLGADKFYQPSSGGHGGGAGASSASHESGMPTGGASGPMHGTPPQAPSLTGGSRRHSSSPLVMGGANPPDTGAALHMPHYGSDGAAIGIGAVGGVHSGRMTPQLSTGDMHDAADVDTAETLSHCSGLDDDERRSIGNGLGSAAPRAVDVVRSLLIMISNNVTQLAYLTCRAEKVNNVFFTGGFVRDNPVVWKQITRSLMYWTNSEISAHFLLHDGYLGALGSLLTVDINSAGTSE